MSRHTCLFEKLGYAAALVLIWKLSQLFKSFLDFFFQRQPPKVVVEMTKEETEVELKGYPKFEYAKIYGEKKEVFYFDPSTMDYFGSTKAMGPEDVQAAVSRARVAQEAWKHSSFATRRLLMRTMQRYITENQENCARVAVRDSGKTLLDAIIGEVLVTCEKLSWLAGSGEQYLQPESRDTGRMMMMKKVRVEYIPLGVIGAIVPWNYVSSCLIIVARPVLIYYMIFDSPSTTCSTPFLLRSSPETLLSSKCPSMPPGPSATTSASSTPVWRPWVRRRTWCSSWLDTARPDTLS